MIHCQNRKTLLNRYLPNIALQRTATRASAARVR